MTTKNTSIGKRTKSVRFVKSTDLAEELLESELAMIRKASNPRRSHLKNIDALDAKSDGHKTRRHCPTGKRKFRDKKEADRVLHFIMNDRRRAEAEGRNFRFKQYRSYICPCGFAHHSSKPDLASLEALNVA